MANPIGRRPVPLLVVGAALLRLAVLRRVAPTPAEGLLLDAVDTGEMLLLPPTAWSRPWVMILSLLDRFTGAPPPPIPDVPALPSDPDPLLQAAHLVAAILGVAAVGLVAAAARRLAGLRAAWVAGGLIALSPLALSHCASAGPGSWHLAVAAAFLWAVCRLPTSAPRWGPVLAGALGGLALGSGGAGAGLLAGLLAGGFSPWGWIAVAAVATLLSPGAGLGLLELPPVSPAGSTRAASPLASGVRLLVTGIGGPALALAALGKIGVLRGKSGNRAGHAVVLATAGAFVVGLLRFGPSPAVLVTVLPGLAILAGVTVAALGSARVRGGRPAPAWLLPGVAAVTLAGVTVGAVPVVSAWRKPEPARQVADWIRANAPPGAAILSEEPALPVPTTEGVDRMNALADSGIVSREEADRYAGDGHTFSVVPLPPATSDPLEASLFYDPNLAEPFDFLVLRPPPEETVDTFDEQDVPATIRRLFQDYFRQAWTLHGRFGSSAAGDEELSLYGRPPDFELDRDALVPTLRLLTSEVLMARREQSDTFTEWALEAGHALLKAGDPARARPALGMVTERDPNNVDGRYQYARVLTLLGEIAEAKAQLLTGMNLDPFHGGIHLHLGAILEEEGDTTGALIEYQAAVLNLEDPTPAHARLGALFHRLGHVEAARDQLTELEATAPDADVTRALRSLLLRSP